MNAASRVAVIGLGYVGLPTAASLAAAGLEVIGVDVNPAVVESVSRGEAPLAEPEVSAEVRRAVRAGRLKASAHVPPADAYIVAVPTPLAAAGGAELGHVTAAVDAVADVLGGGETVVIESTVPPGTTRRMSARIAERRPGLDLPRRGGTGAGVAVAHCPERVLPGRIMTEIAANDRLIGGITPSCAARAAGLYRAFCSGELILTDSDTAEMAKLAENSYRDVNVAFANELANVCDQLSLDVWEVRQLANRHPRVDILRPGPGVGGHCIAVDPWFIVDAAPGAAPLIRAARMVNDGRPELVAGRIIAAYRQHGGGAVACLGLSYKAEVGDLRGSPAAQIVRRVAEALPGTAVLAADPFVTALPGPLAALGNVALASAPDAVRRASVVALLVDHGRFRAITGDQLAGKAVCDTRGMWSERA
jgi:UDP-N-acetyl-D-mannosaminuronic acid dehydrogenase